MDNPPNDGPCEVTITVPDREWLQAFVRQLVEERLVAAAHVDMMHTTYRWAGLVHEGSEARARLHSTFNNVREIFSRTRTSHDFEVMCVVATEIVDGDPRYLQWVIESSSPQP